MHSFALKVHSWSGVCRNDCNVLMNPLTKKFFQYHLRFLVTAPVVMYCVEIQQWNCLFFSCLQSQWTKWVDFKFMCSWIQLLSQVNLVNSIMGMYFIVLVKLSFFCPGVIMFVYVAINENAPRRKISLLSSFSLLGDPFVGMDVFGDSLKSD